MESLSPKHNNKTKLQCKTVFNQQFWHSGGGVRRFKSSRPSSDIILNCLRSQPGLLEPLCQTKGDKSTNLQYKTCSYFFRLVMFFFNLLFHFFFLGGTVCIALAGLEFASYTRLASNSERSACFCLPSAVINGAHHYFLVCLISF